ncbi:MAG: FtsH protease activity modulator HflK [Pseudomonadota bacterium]
MAWNEPGNNGNGSKDPWGNNNDGPPELDEAWRRFKSSLDGIFGGSGGSGGSTGAGGSGFTAGSFGVFALAVAIIWGASGFYQVDQQEEAVVLRFGVYLETNGAGLHWNPRFIDEVTRENVTKVRSISHSAHMLTEDENIVDVSLSVQYTVNDLQKFVLAIRDPERSLQHATESSLRHVVGGSGMDEVLTAGREQIATEVQARLQDYVDVYQTGILVAKVNIEGAQPPDEVKAAFDDVIKAREDEVRSRNEAEAYANQIVPEARGAAQRQLEEANAYKEQVIANSEGEAERFEKLLSEYRKAPQVTRERLYLDAVQEVMSKSSKVMVDVEGGNNLLYLPLDKIVQNSAAAGGQVDQIRSLTDQVVRQIKADSQNAARRREGR